MSTRRLTSTSALPPLDRGAADERQQVLDRLRVVQQIRHEHATAIIAEGIFTARVEHWNGILDVLARRMTATDLQRLEAFFDRLEAAQPDSTHIPGEYPHDACDVLGVIAAGWGDAGFLVGLAVGMQLGPHAFDGGAR